MAIDVFMLFSRSGVGGVTLPSTPELQVKEVQSSTHYAIELKFPRSGQHPEQMFSFCKDIAFAEELPAAGFRQTAFVAVADDPLFYRGAVNGIYAYFRGQKPLAGTVTKPTGAKNDSVKVRGPYTIRWVPVAGTTQYTLVTVGDDA